MGKNASCGYRPEKAILSLDEGFIEIYIWKGFLKKANS